MCQAESEHFIVDIEGGEPKTLTERLMGGPIWVHGREDLERRQAAAKEAGVTLTVRPAPPAE